MYTSMCGGCVFLRVYIVCVILRHVLCVVFCVMYCVWFSMLLVYNHVYHMIMRITAFVLFLSACVPQRTMLPLTLPPLFPPHTTPPLSLG